MLSGSFVDHNPTTSTSFNNLLNLKEDQLQLMDNFLKKYRNLCIGQLQFLKASSTIQSFGNPQTFAKVYRMVVQFPDLKLFFNSQQHYKAALKSFRYHAVKAFQKVKEKFPILSFFAHDYTAFNIIVEKIIPGDYLPDIDVQDLMFSVGPDLDQLLRHLFKAMVKDQSKSISAKAAKITIISAISEAFSIFPSEMQSNFSTSSLFKSPTKLPFSAIYNNKYKHTLTPSSLFNPVQTTLIPSSSSLSVNEGDSSTSSDTQLPTTIVSCVEEVTVPTVSLSAEEDELGNLSNIPTQPIIHTPPCVSSEDPSIDISIVIAQHLPSINFILVRIPSLSFSSTSKFQQHHNFGYDILNPPLQLGWFDPLSYRPPIVATDIISGD